MAWFKDFAYHVIVIIGRSINVLDNFRGFTVDMSTVVILIFNLEPRVLKFSDVNSGSFGVFTEEIS